MRRLKLAWYALLALALAGAACSEIWSLMLGSRWAFVRAVGDCIGVWAFASLAKRQWLAQRVESDERKAAAG